MIVNCVIQLEDRVDKKVSNTEHALTNLDLFVEKYDECQKQFLNEIKCG